jgi:hypothetical protein
MENVAQLKGLKPFERCVLANLAWRANQKTHLCWPSVERIAAETGVSERQVYRALKSLRAKSLIRAKGKTKYGTVQYLVTPGSSCAGSPIPQLAGDVCQVGTECLPSAPSNWGWPIPTQPHQQCR